LTTGEILVQTNISVAVSLLASQKYEGRMNSFLLLVGALGNIFGTNLMGLIISGYSFNIAWLVIIVMSMLYSYLMFKIYQKIT
jgi:uncharacterized membrane protein YsdA (DUF1294 family)